MSLPVLKCNQTLHFFYQTFQASNESPGIILFSSLAFYAGKKKEVKLIYLGKGGEGQHVSSSL